MKKRHSAKITIIAFTVGLTITLMTGCSFKYSGANKTFQRNKHELVKTCEYLESTGYYNVYIPNSFGRGEISVLDGYRTNIRDGEAVGAIEKLKKRGCQVIIKKGDTIYFQMWSNLDEGRGLAYSGGSCKPTPYEANIVISFKELEEKDWYYYDSR